MILYHDDLTLELKDMEQIHQGSSCNFGFDGNSFGIHDFESFKFNSIKVFGWDIDNIMAEPGEQVGNSYDKFMELNSTIEETLCDLFYYSESKTFIYILFVFLKFEF